MKIELSIEELDAVLFALESCRQDDNATYAEIKERLTAIWGMEFPREQDRRRLAKVDGLDADERHMPDEATKYKNRIITTLFYGAAKTWSYIIYTRNTHDGDVLPAHREVTGFASREDALTAGKAWADRRWCACPVCEDASEEGCPNEATILFPQSETCDSDYWMCPQCAGFASGHHRDLRAPDDNALPAEMTTEQLAAEMKQPSLCGPEDFADECPEEVRFMASDDKAEAAENE
jgi:hypothetical protein